MSAFDDRGAAATTVYNPYKIFQAAQRCMGDPSVVAIVLVELLGNCATQDVLMGAAASVLNLYYGKGGLRVCSMTDFGKFAGELAEELGKRNSLEAEEKMKEAQSVYELFEEADTDRSGTISKEEFINFEASIGVTSEAEALELFAQVDSDKNGVISFVEWLQYCVPGPGCDKDSFDCAGRHGLRSYSTAINGVSCNWCENLYPVGSKMFACRECDCDACLECAISHLQSCTTRISCERAGSSSCSLCPPPEEEEGGNGEDV